MYPHVFQYSAANKWSIKLEINGNITAKGINPFNTTGLFLYSLKKLENPWFSDVFRGFGKRAVVWNELKRLHFEKILCWTPANSWFKTISKNIQKQLFAAVLQNRCPWKFRKTHRKITELETFFNKVAGFQACNFIEKRIQTNSFLYILWNFQEHLFWRKLANDYYI